MGFEYILVERSGQFATITMNRPQRRNALSLEHMRELIAAGAAVSPEMVKSYIAAFEAGGCDEIIFVPTASRLDQVSLLADAIA